MLRANSANRNSQWSERHFTPDLGDAALPQLLTVPDVARWLNITPKAVYAKAERGSLPGATRIGRRLYFIRSELLQFVQQGRVPYLGDAHDGT